MNEKRVAMVWLLFQVGLELESDSDSIAGGSSLTELEPHSVA